MNNYTILAVVNLIWFLFVILILKASHDLRMKLQNELDGLNHKRNRELESVSENLRTANRMADELRKDCVRLKSQLEAVDRARDKYVTDIINNNSTIADLKSQLETSAKTIEELLDAASARNVEISNLEQNVERLKEEGGRFAQLSHTRGNELIEQRNQAEKFRFEREQLKAELHEFRKYHTSLRTAVGNAVSSLGTALEET